MVMPSFTWGSVEGQSAAVEAAFRTEPRFDMGLNRTEFANMLAVLVYAATESEGLPDHLQEWASGFAGAMAEVSGVDWV